MPRAASVAKSSESEATAPTTPALLVSNHKVRDIHWILLASSGLLTLCLIAICIVSSQFSVLETAAGTGFGLTNNLRSLFGAGITVSEGAQSELSASAVEIARLLRLIQERSKPVAWLLPDAVARNTATAESLWQTVQPNLLAAAPNAPVPPQAHSDLKDRIPALASALQALEASFADAKATAHLLFSGIAWILCVLMLLGVIAASVYFESLLRGATNCMRGIVGEIRGAGSFTRMRSTSRPGLEELPEAMAGLSKELYGLVRLIHGDRQVLAEALDCVSAGAIILSSDWKVQVMNRYCSKLLGVTPDSVRGKALEEVLPAGVSSLRDQINAQGARAWADLTTLIQAESLERTLSLRLRQVWAAEEQGRTFVLLVEDAGDPTQPTAEDYERLYERILESVSEAVFLVDQDGVVLDLNRHAAALCGYSRNELLRTRIQHLQRRPSDDRDQWLDSYLRSAEWQLDGAVVKAQVARKDDTSFSAEFRFARFGLERRAAYLVTLRDLTSDEMAASLSQDRMRIIEMIARNEPPEQVLPFVATLIEHQVPGVRCVVRRRCPGHAPALTTPSLSPELVRSVYESATEPTADLRFLPDAVATAPSEDLREAALIPGMQFVFSEPIFSSQGVPIGMIDVHRPESREPSEAEIELFRLASRFASVSIEQSELNSELAYRAQHDPLTGLLNRASFEQRMVRTVAHASRYGRRVGFLSLDLDRFKIINDMLGHAAGDELITQLARRLSSCFRETDFVARWGGDEFVVGLTEIGEPQDAHKAAAKLLDTLKAPFQLGGREITTTASIGVSVFPDDGPDLETLIRRADTAMYRAKRNGRNGFHCYNAGIGEMDRRRLEMEAHLRIALERGEFSLSYQPQVDLRTGALGGLEALLRWHNTELGPIPPSTFIPIAEESGFIIQIGDWVVRQACKQIKEFERSGCGPIRVAVNVSGIQFSRGDFVDVVAQAIEDAKIESRFLELELTESFLMEPCNGADTRMESLRALGVKISIDDFGTGFSSLSSLHQLPIDCLKIDQSFVRGLGESPRAPVFVGSILALAKSLGIVTIAEGVESKEQLDVLRESGCDLVQGYLLGVPLSPSQIISRLVWPEARGTWCSNLASPQYSRRQRPRRDVAGVSGRKQYAGVA